ncbi:histidine phosphatase superfamily [Rhexocercosporidium sp. MPI-PUGE-AT-0058]|nr:histidine phosphatase superfamily [Rhexocercosporidium sp. MPI-PUGE-AT-0058]
MATPELKTNVYIHLIRHAQAQHNYDPKTATPAQKALCRAFINPHLTPHGHAESLDLRHRFPYMSLLTHILTSPLRRTLETTLIALEPAILQNIPTIAIEELREIGMGPSSTGTDISEVLRELGDMGKWVLTDNVKENWEFNLEQRSEAEERAEKVKRMLKDLGDVVCGRVGDAELDPDEEVKLWNNYAFSPLPEGRDVHIAVVSHAGFLRKILGDNRGNQFGNAEFRSFRFRGDEAGLEGDQKSWDLIETLESRGLLHPSTEEEDLAEREIAREAREVRVSGVEINVVEVEDDEVETLEEVDNGLDTSLLDPMLFV